MRHQYKVLYCTCKTIRDGNAPYDEDVICEAFRCFEETMTRLNAGAW